MTKSIGVFCSATFGNDPQFKQVAKELGERLAEQKIQLVFGGGKVGLMGVVADSALARGGDVIGVIPDFLGTREVIHQGLTELIICKTMLERKTKMIDLSNGFIALPGGFGTLDEMLEVLTYHQLGLNKHPIAFLNVNGFYDHLDRFFKHLEHTELLKPEARNIAYFGTTIDEVINHVLR